ncbi:MAG: serine protease [candidate division KSB1 bacterium]|nr:serine protease [candidate division KSB1 bacterium]
MKKYIISLVLLLPIYCFSQWLDQGSLQATVLLEKLKDSELIPHGTGFLLYNYDNPRDYIVVTCAHLIKNRNEIFVRMNIDSSITQAFKEKGKIDGIYTAERNWEIIENNIVFKINLSSNPKSYVINDSLDIGAFFINIPILIVEDDTSKKALKFSQKLGVPKSGFKYRKELSLGDEVYFIGFPFGIGASKTITPIVRSGSIAWLPSGYPGFLLDSFSFGGNSGSPIFCKVLLGTKIGKLNWDAPKLIGMIIGHHGIKLDNVLTQPNPDELKFEKGSLEMNFGLARCVFIDDILKVTEQLVTN